jgi:hypothetical protein
MANDISMKPNPRQVADLHQQHHAGSCATSLAELLLKLEGENPPDLQQHEPGGQSTGLTHLKDKTYGQVTFRQFSRNEPLSDLVERELAAGRAVGVFFENKHFDPTMKGIHGWAAVEVCDVGGAKHVRLLAKQSELGKGEGKVTLDLTIRLTDLNIGPVTDAVTYLTTPSPLA